MPPTPATLEIDVNDRWHAVQLLERLAPFRPHLVQLEFPDGRWLVRAHAPGTHGEGVLSALDTIDAWSREREVPSVGVCLAGLRPLMESELKRALRRKAARAASAGPR